jgi:EpsI family protein
VNATESKQRKQPQAEPAPPSFLGKVLIALFALVVTQGVVLAIQAAYAPDHVREPRMALESLPMDIGEDWRGTESVELDPAIFVKLRASEAVQRFYTNEEGTGVTVHCAYWRDPEVSTPHLPTVCYPGQGWTTGNGYTVSLPGHEQAHVRVQRFSQEGQGRVVTMYWYQIGDMTYFNRDSSRAVQRSLWGTKTRPPTVKVLMQVEDNGDSKQDPVEALQEIGAEVYAWVSGL